MKVGQSSTGLGHLLLILVQLIKPSNFGADVLLESLSPAWIAANVESDMGQLHGESCAACNWHKFKSHLTNPCGRKWIPKNPRIQHITYSQMCF
jgi:hypothetical protein